MCGARLVVAHYNCIRKTAKESQGSLHEEQVQYGRQMIDQRIGSEYDTPIVSIAVDIIRTVGQYLGETFSNISR